MGDVSYLQTLSIVAGKTPDSGTALRDKDFEVSQEQTQVTDINEDTYQRFVVDAGAVDQPLCQGTISTVKIVYIRPSSDLLVKLVNPSSVSCEYTFFANRTSILHMPLSQVLVSNPTTAPIKGTLFFAGD